MKGSELIRELEKLPEDAVVVCAGAEVITVEDGLGLCTPAGYWYGQHFGLDGFGMESPKKVCWLE